MKKTTKKTRQAQVIKELSDHFTDELDRQLTVNVLPDGATVYKEFIIKKHKTTGKWAVYYISNRDLIAQFFLKSCALMAAKAYGSNNLARFHEAEQLDHQYWSNYSDNLVYQKNIKVTPEFERYKILLNKLEDTAQKTEYYKDKISKMFKWSFV